MQEIRIGENEAGQRMDKFLHKLMPLAPFSFFYKMLRKKNIMLNGKKAQGKEILALEDTISLYLSQETIDRLKNSKADVTKYQEAFRLLQGIDVIYEDENILILNKPVGVLSQKAQQEDFSLNEWMIGYLLEKKDVDENLLMTYKPSICNRLDRNTQGLVIGARSFVGSQKMNQLLRDRKIRKYYGLFVKGQLKREGILEGFLVKDTKNNKVRLVEESSLEKSDYIKTRYYPVRQFEDRTFVEAELITGKPHQIRMHMASIGHPILGDYKYGDRKWNDRYKKSCQINRQLLCALRLEFPEMEAPFENLDKKVFEIPLPEEFQNLMKE